MAQVRGLGYLVVESTDVEAWRSFGTQAIGMMEMPAPGEGWLHLKMDERQFRLAVVPGEEDRLICSGWQLANEVEFEAAIDELRSAGHVVKEGTSDEMDARHVNGLVHVTDPGGADLELFHGPRYDHTVFVSPAGVSGFVTGELGMGHLVMLSPAVDEAWGFYRELLGFRLSDTMRRGDSLVRFTHCNKRHHSLGLAPGEKSTMQHFMVQVGSLDDVGYAYDRFLDLGVRMHMSIGKHTNDHMVSFYAQTPGRFSVEYGWGAIDVDDSTWTTGEITAPSFWGHRRVPKPPQ